MSDVQFDRRLQVWAAYAGVLATIGLLGLTVSFTAGLAAVLLATPTLVLCMQWGWFQGRITRAFLFAVHLLAPTIATALMRIVPPRLDGLSTLMLSLVVGLLSSIVAGFLVRAGILRVRPRVFLSYRRAQSAHVVDRLSQDLVKRYGQRYVFHDIRSIPLGADLPDLIGRMITRVDVLLAVIGPQWVDARDDNGRRRLHANDDYVRLELEKALKAGVRIVPVLVDDARLPTREQLPPSLAPLATRAATHLRPGTDWPHDLRTLTSRIEHAKGTDGDGRPRPARARAGVMLALLALILGQVAVANVCADVWTDISLEASPDGTRVISVSDRGAPPGRAFFRLWDTGSGHLLRTTRYPTRNLRVVEWSPSGDRFVTGDAAGRIQVWDSTTLEPGALLSDFVGTVGSLSWSPDGASVAALDDDGTLRVWDASTGDVLGLQRDLATSVILAQVVWAPRGHLIATSGGSNVLTVLRWRDRKLTVVHKQPDGSSSYSGALAWSPNGRALAASTGGAPFLLTFAEKTDKPATVPLQAGAGAWGGYSHLAWSPGGGRLVGVSDGFQTVARVWDSGGVLESSYTLSSPTDYLVLSSFLWAPGEDSFAVGSDETVMVVNRQTGAQEELPVQGETQLLGWTLAGLQVGAAPTGSMAFQIWRFGPGPRGRGWVTRAQRDFAVTPIAGVRTWLSALPSS